MIEMLTMWFWAYVIGSAIGAAILFFGIYTMIYAEVAKARAEKRAKETPSQRWIKGG